MAETMFVLGGQTASRRAAMLLRRKGVAAQVARAPQTPGLGCGYGVLVDRERREEALRLLRQNRFRILAVQEQEESG